MALATTRICKWHFWQLCGHYPKIVQRLPVRIALDPAELAAHPLRIGLSMTVDADTRDQSGSQLGAAQNTHYRTDVFAQYDVQANAEIDKIIKQNEMVSRAMTAQPQSQPQSQRVASHEHKGNAG